MRRAPIAAAFILGLVFPTRWLNYILPPLTMLGWALAALLIPGGMLVLGSAWLLPVFTRPVSLSLNHHSRKPLCRPPNQFHLGILIPVGMPIRQDVRVRVV